MQLDIGDIFSENDSDFEYRLNDIDFGTFKMGHVDNPNVYKWIFSKEDLLSRFTRIKESPHKITFGKTLK